MSLATRLALIAVALLLPALFLLRVILRALRKQRYFWRVMLALPYLAVISTAWGWGELTGYITARGRSASAQGRRST